MISRVARLRSLRSRGSGQAFVKSSSKRSIDDHGYYDDINASYVDSSDKAFLSLNTTTIISTLVKIL